MSGSAEDSILNSIPDFQDDGGGHEDTSSSTTQGTPSQTNQAGDGDQRTSAQPTQTDRSGGGTQRDTQQSFRRRRDGLVERPSTDPDTPNARDLVDPVTGRVVARGGIERHVYEEGQRHARENTQLKQQLQQVSGALQGVNEVTREAARLNISPQDQMIAMRVMSDFMQDPVRTLQYLVEEVKSKGYSIPFLAQGVSPGMDMNAIARMIDTKLQPFTQRTVQEQQQQQVRAQAQRELDQFLADNEDANSNLDVLSEMLQAQPSLTIQTAYTRMIRWAHENGLDWTQPLKPQIAALQSGNGQQPTHQQTTQQPTRRPLPGRGGNGQQTQPLQPNGQGSGTTYNENASWAEIIRHAMHENDVRFN